MTALQIAAIGALFMEAEPGEGTRGVVVVGRDGHRAGGYGNVGRGR